MSVKHTNDIVPCPACSDKLIQAHPELVQWFNEKVKPNYHDCHISWSFRGKMDQEQAFLEGKSKLHYPLSAHNKTNLDSEPCAMALDLFQLDSRGVGLWRWPYFKAIADEANSSSMPLMWGGDFKTLGDADHFELISHPDQIKAS